MNPNTQEINKYDSRKFENLKYDISNESNAVNDIFLDNSYDPELNFFSKNVRNLDTMYKSSHRRCSVKKGVLKNLAKFTGKHLCQSHIFNKVAGLGKW